MKIFNNQESIYGKFFDCISNELKTAIHHSDQLIQNIGGHPIIGQENFISAFLRFQLFSLYLTSGPFYSIT